MDTFKLQTEFDLRDICRGVMMCPMDQLTAQGYDLQFGTNVVGELLLGRRVYLSNVAQATFASRNCYFLSLSQRPKVLELPFALSTRPL